MAKEPKQKRPPIAADPERLSMPARRLAGSLTSDTRICRIFLSDERYAGSVAYWTEPDGNRVDRRAVAELILKGHIVLQNDGLFPDLGQTFVLA